MDVFLFLVCIGLSVTILFYKWRHAKELQEKNLEIEEGALELRRRIRITNGLKKRVLALKKYEVIEDALAEADRIRSKSSEDQAEALLYARQIKTSAEARAQSTQDKADQQLARAFTESDLIVATAKANADAIAGDALKAMNKAKDYEAAIKAMGNIIKGYGDQYIVPSYSLLDDLAEEFSFTDAGQCLSQARERSKNLAASGRAGDCDYSEASRRETAIRFVTDAFNGKVDSVLSRVKTDNFGKLSQEIQDAYALVNLNGGAFRMARITEEYLGSRIVELKWACVALELKEKAKEEQRQIREQMREEDKARKEFERAAKDAAKEEESLRKLMLKAEQQIAAASDSQRAEFEAKLAALQSQLQEAEQKNQRTLSMAQQTRAGHVYIISNVGSFGENVFKIGMTRRLEPNDRVKELGDASVPFEFDVHAMIYHDDAPMLEKSLHRHFLRQQVNKVNSRKEFFKLDLTTIRSELESLGVQTQWTMAATATEYKETLRIEQQIAENPEIEQVWTRNQLEEVDLSTGDQEDAA